MASSEAITSTPDDTIPELIVKQGDDIDYRVVLAAYVLADLGMSQ